MTILVPEDFKDEAAAGDLVSDTESSLTVGGTGTSDSGGGSALSTAQLLANRLAALNSAGGSGLSLLGFNASTTQDVVVGTETRQVEASCPPGYWCSAALTIPCGPNTYQPKIDQIFAGACLPCPEDAEAPEASTGFEACQCIAGRFMTQELTCKPCPLPGTECTTAGTSLEMIPLEHGYWRPNNVSLDVRPCPDQSEGNASACGGGVALCKAHLDLTGVYCRTCIDDDSYYVASACSPCGSLVTDWTLTFVGIVFGVVAAILLALAAWRKRNVREKLLVIHRRATSKVLETVRRFHLASKMCATASRILSPAQRAPTYSRAACDAANAAGR